ncbi:UNVERIFIED_CONTAM: Glutelin type-A 2 [Sesamum calycinum]|uniref:Glutelin type-A 2 n=1 Tax=Sesamum calycinum TaxID=2727403 RepID=A0AAW2LIW3_9LAMI
MELDLTPKLAKKLYGGDGGAYYAWCPNELPMLREGNIGAAKLALEKNGFALPRYSDSAKVAHVLQGSGVAGIVLPEKEEKVLPIKKGDAIALPFGVVTWWYNKEDTELVVLFLGDTSKAHKSEHGTWRRALLKPLLVANQEQESSSRCQSNNGMALNCEEAPLDVDIKDGGKVVVLNTKNLPLVGHLHCQGSGRVQVVGVDGKRVLETTIKAGSLFIVPRFFVVSKIADPDGMDWFSIITTPNPVFTHLAGRTSVWKALSPEVLQAAFGVPPDVEQKFSSKRKAEEIFFPPPN